MSMALKYPIEAHIYANCVILACDLHYSIKLISKKLLLCSMIKDSLTIITHSTTKMFVFKSLTNHNKEVILNTQHKTCQTYYLELINKNSEVFHRSGLYNVVITPRHIWTSLVIIQNQCMENIENHFRWVSKGEYRDGNTSKYHSLLSLIVVASNLA